MKRSELGPGRKALERGSTFASRGDGPKPSAPRSSRPPQPISAASTPQRRKVHLQACAVCGAIGCDPAHLTPRSFRGCDDADCVIALCRRHHREFDDGKLDLLPHLAGHGYHVELAHMQAHYDDPLSVVFRLSGQRWVPEHERRAA